MRINNYPQDVNLVIQTMNLGDVVETRTLLNQYGEADAYYLEFSEGYIIYDLNGVVIEYSDVMQPPFSESENEVYYVGPFLYYFIDDGKYVNFSNGSVVSSLEFSEVCDKFLAISSNTNDLTAVSSFSTNSSPVTSIIKLEDPVSCPAWNSGVECGSLAALHLLLYYSEVKGQMLTNSFFDSNHRSLYNCLISYIQQDGSNCPHYDANSHACTVDSLRDGLNAFLDTQNCRLRLKEEINMSVSSMASMTIGSAKVPVLICYNPGTVMGHIVLSYCYRVIKVNNQIVHEDFIVNDGYGNNGRYVNEIYVQHLLFLIT